MEVFLVGGAVRDMILGLPNEDQDFVVVGATPDQMVALGFVPIEAVSFPIFLDSFGREFALARTEKKIGPGYHGFETRFDSSITLDDDLYRRDLTMNAMAIRVEDFGADGSIVLDTQTTGDKYIQVSGVSVYDPFGGYTDIQQRTIRHVSFAFTEDPVRVLRAARFAAKFGFNISKSTWDVMHELVEKGELNHVTPERVWLELTKAAKTGTLPRFLDHMMHCGALSVVLPELNEDVCVFEQLNTTGFEALPYELAISVVFGMFAPPDALDTLMGVRLRAPSNVIELTKAFQTVTVIASKLTFSDSRVTAEMMLELIYDLDLFRHPDRAVSIAQMLSIFKTPSLYEELGSLIEPSFEITKLIHFESLPFVDQRQLKGAAIGRAIRKRRLESLENFFEN